MKDFIIANATDTGKVRSVNEDSMTTFDSPNGRVIVVCDGIGGQNAGDVASQLAVSVIQDILTDNKFNSPEEAISKSMIAANQAILMRSSKDMALSGMGATCVMVIIYDDKVYYGSVGDSRIYYFADGMVMQLTKDQSYVQTLVDAGEITLEDAEHHKDKNQIMNALGIEGMTPPVVCQMPITPKPGSVFLLCSDGLTGMVSNNVINQVISNSSLSLQDKVKELVNLANSAGGLDNITVQLVEFRNDSATEGVPKTGNKRVVKSRKNRAVLYWTVTIVCMLLVVGGVTYWLLPKDDSKPKSTATTTTTTKSETEKPKTSGPSQPAVEPQTTTVVTHSAEDPAKNLKENTSNARKIDDKLSRKGAAKNNKKDNVLEKAKEVQNSSAPESEEKRITNLAGEKE